jgi:hypothetical protein
VLEFVWGLRETERERESERERERERKKESSVININKQHVINC